MHVRWDCWVRGADKLGAPYLLRCHAQNWAHDRDDDASHEGWAEAGDGDAGAQDVDREVARQLEHETVDHELEDAERHDGERQRDGWDERLDERVHKAQKEAHEGEADPSVSHAEGLDAWDDERGDRDGDRG